MHVRVTTCKAVETNAVKTNHLTDEVFVDGFKSVAYLACCMIVS